ncbi:MAG: hypothetical protein LBU32_24335 [Clostridiales bacterium]|nr:hypothetical protein [Clostridiales bacterium]
MQPSQAFSIEKSSRQEADFSPVLFTRGKSEPLFPCLPINCIATVKIGAMMSTGA